MQYPNVGTSVQVRFAVRAGGFAKETVAALQREHAVHADMLLLFGVAAAEHVVRGRVLLLLEWLRVAPRLFPSAQWVVKADGECASDWARVRCRSGCARAARRAIRRLTGGSARLALWSQTTRTS